MIDQKIIRVLVVGCGNMGSSHAIAYHEIEGFAICGLVSKGNSKNVLNEKLGGGNALFDDYEEALKKTKPDAVCISTYPDTHADYAIKAFEQGCHVFLEKPIATTFEDAKRVVDTARKYNKKLIIGYILRVHPSWIKFIELSRTLGNPLVMRMNLNQQSHGKMWQTHLNLMNSLSPIVDCGVHYIDVMCQMTRSRPVKVQAMGARLTDEIPEWNYNYGQLQIHFENGSIGWYEAAWGPMISETAFFVKDVIGPKGSVSIVAKEASGGGNSADIDMHTKTESIRLHHSDIDGQNEFTRKDEWVDLTDEPNHQELCNREQLHFLTAIHEDLDLTEEMENAVDSLRVALACDESIKEEKAVTLSKY